MAVRKLPAPSPRLGRWVLTLPSFLAGLFTLGLGIFLVYTIYSDRLNRSAQMEQDLLWQKQALQLQMGNTRHELESLAATLAANGLTSADFTARTLSLIQNTPELISLAYVDETGQTRWRTPLAPPDNEIPLSHRNLVAQRAAVLLNDEQIYSPPITDTSAGPVIALTSPVKLPFEGRHFLIAQFDLNRLLSQQVPWWIGQRYQISLLRADGSVLASKFDRRQDAAKLAQQIDLDIGPENLRLQARVYRETGTWKQNAMLGALVGLSLLMLVSTWVMRRHIRERQKTEALLRRETAMRMAMEDSLITGTRVMDLEGRLTYVNRAFCDMTGYSAEELLNHEQIMPYWPPDALETCLAINRRILAGETDSSGFQCTFQRRNGERFDVRIYAARLVDGEGQHIGWISSIYDITELQREREALQASHERFVTVLNGLDAAVVVSDAVSGELLLSNRQYQYEFNLPVQHERCCVIPFLPREQTAALPAEWFDDFAQRWYQIKTRPSIWVDGSLVWLEILTDITALKDAQQREQQQNEQLQQTSRLISMGEMASSLAHELNQPLAAIASYATGCRNLLGQAEPNLRQLDQAIEKMAEQAKRAGLIIRGIREFVQRRAPHRSACAMDQLLATVQVLLAAHVKKSNVKLHLDCDPLLPPVFADPVMLEQVLFNLMKNAIEAMHETPANQRQLQVLVARRDEMLQVTIADRGAGISAEQLEQLFKAFYTTKSTGMGMGLNICRSIIEHHHGRLWVEANPGGGTRFHFTVPLSEDSHAREP
ncbi:PAS domain-containing sensor histidine kinase [Chitinilyticum piscinae]|uniref:histidine kinase n=1 Tax=Chitinilyticum piscinae TaxID=2866724 RepID=A0A8J7KAF6_9NEIS|nr:ATP-binding protein [Chitinilyticum piscinae]MBE9609079.1 PAS domain S-box protein [Chitinilyticum piscinae]